MNRPAKLWEVLAAIIPVVSCIVIWLWNLGATVNGHGKDIEYMKETQIEYKQSQMEYKEDIKEIKGKMETILLKLENKKDR